MENNSILTVGFWFGQNRPVNGNESVFTYDFDFNNIVEDYKKFEVQYAEFKKRNPNPSVPYEDLLINEECLIFFHDIEPQYSTFQEIYLMMKQLEPVQIKQDKLNAEINSLENKKFELYEEVFNNMECDTQTISLDKILTPVQIDTITSIYNKNSNQTKFEKSLRRYLKSIKGDLNKKGIDYRYLTYSLSHSILKQVA
ncbi:MAG: hypothetical protein U9Q33_13520 [Campylobacterota bacterium]|nr:hypothetical protein [Campylobacterota bacterium]